jgi:predicted hydrocarbon binding protein
MNPLAALKYVRATAGTEGIAQVLAGMREDELVLLGASEHSPRKLSARSWVPFRLQARLLRAIDAAFGDEETTVLFEVGRFMGSHDVPLAFRPFLRLGNPGWIMEVATRLWRYYHDRGHWVLERTPYTMMCTLHDHPESDVAFCETFQGWITGALEVSGAHQVEVHHPVCHARGAQNCVFTVRWQSTPQGTDAGE